MEYGKQDYSRSIIHNNINPGRRGAGPPARRRPPPRARLPDGRALAEGARRRRPEQRDRVVDERPPDLPEVALERRSVLVLELAHRVPLPRGPRHERASAATGSPLAPGRTPRDP